MVLNRVLVTGASGMVGVHTCRALSARGIGVVATSRSRPSDLPKELDWIAFDLAERKSADDYRDAFGDVNAVVHCGAFVPRPGLAPDARTMIDVNVGACHTLGAWAQDIGAHVVYISGVAVYADPDAPAITERAPTGYNSATGLYGASKLMGEMVFQDLAGQGLMVTSLRASAVYGPGLPDGKMIPNFLKAARNGETITLSPPVDDRADLVFAGDVAEAACLAIELKKPGVFNIGAGVLHSVKEIAEGCVAVAGGGDVVVTDAPAGRAPYRRYDIDITAARTQLGYAPATSLLDGLATMLRESRLGQDEEQEEEHA